MESRDVEHEQPLEAARSHLQQFATAAPLVSSRTKRIKGDAKDY